MESNFKILMSADNSFNVRNWSHTLCNILQKEFNAEILLVFIGNIDDEVKNWFESEGFGVKIFQKPLLIDENYNNYEESANELKLFLEEIIDEFKPNVIHLNHFIGKLKTSFPVVLNANNIITSRIKNFRKNGMIKQADKYHELATESFNCADKIIVPSYFSLKSLYENFNINQKIEVIYNTDNFKQSAQTCEYGNIITAPECFKKNQLLLNNLLSKLPENVHLMVPSTNPCNKNYKRVVFLEQENKESIQQMFEKSSIYLALNYHDEYNISPVRAAFSKCAIVANDSDFFKEVWGDCAHLIPIKNPNYLIRTVNNLLENAHLLKNIAQKCYNKAMAAFNPKYTATRYMNVYKSLCKNNKVLKEVQ